MDVRELISKNRAGTRLGLPSFCTANEFVLRGILGFAVERNLPVLVEATCNQVNQEGGYTGMQPAEFAAWLSQLATATGLAADQLVLGGDHLGPNPWRNESPEIALAKADQMVRDYVKAGFRKIHLDASMACGGEPRPSFSEVAHRAAKLCRSAEECAPEPSALIYVIGTEVPVPGGETDGMTGLQITTPERLEETITTHRQAFDEAGIGDAWNRVVSVVTQPGVDFSHSSVHQFNPAAAQDLVTAIKQYDDLTFEGHSTDYQPTASLAELVERHVFFLKVGPELTFRFREAVFALAAIENTLCPDTRSKIVEVLDSAMEQKPEDWNAYYDGSPQQVTLLKHYSLSDRIRYYWQDIGVRASLERLFENLSDKDIPQGLATQYFGDLEFGEFLGGPGDLCRRHIQRSVGRYYSACGLTV